MVRRGRSPSPETGDPLRLTALEIASGVVCGAANGYQAAVTDAADRDPTPLEALEAAVREALCRSPCLVSFSGGLDSSVVLAVAVRVARRQGLDDPVPVSWRFAHAPRAQESQWQERVIGELGVGDWIRLDAGPELELVGSVALGTLERHGLLYPANAFLHLPLLERARGGSLLTGVGGDEIFGRWRWRTLADARAGRRRPCARDALRWALARGPRSLRAHRIGRRDPCGPLPWLRSPFARQVRLAEALERAAEPDRWDRRVHWQASRRRLALSLRSLELLAADAGASVTCPLLAPGFVAALARAEGRDGFGDRLATLLATLSDVVPRAVRDRRSKATFEEVFLGPRTRRFVSSWEGVGVDTEIVDARALGAIWLEPEPDLRTALLIQQVALARGSALR